MPSYPKADKRAYKAVMRIYGRAAENNITINKLAASAGVSRVTLSNWKHGRAIPMLDIFLAVEAALDKLIAESANGGV